MANNRSNNEKWMSNLAIFRKYIEETKQFPRYNTVYDDRRIGSWYMVQRAKFKENKLSDNKIRLLDEINPFWKEDTEERFKEEERLYNMPDDIISEKMLDTTIPEREDISESIEIIDIEIFNFNRGILNPLRRNNINSVQDLIVAYNSGKLFNIKGLGALRLNEILDKINNLDYYLNLNNNEETRDNTESVINSLIDVFNPFGTSETEESNEDDFVEDDTPIDEEIKPDYSNNGELIPGVIYDTEEDTLEDNMEAIYCEDYTSPVEENHPKVEVCIDEGPASHKYFVSFTYMKGMNRKFGNTIIQLNHKINSFESLVEVTDIIKNTIKCRDMIIISFNEI